jgi:hypothetical protein
MEVLPAEALRLCGIGGAFGGLEAPARAVAPPGPNSRSANMWLVPGYIVYVPPNVFARIGHTVNAVLFPFAPFMGIFNAAVGSMIGFR